MWTRRPDRALAEFQEAIKLNPSLAAAHVLLGQLYVYRGQPDEAIKFAEKVFVSTLETRVNSSGFRPWRGRTTSCAIMNRLSRSAAEPGHLIRTGRPVYAMWSPGSVSSAGSRRHRPRSRN
jgi:hypothetical protein